jgi:hypothetical protein
MPRFVGYVARRVAMTCPDSSDHELLEKKLLAVV